MDERFVHIISPPTEFRPPWYLRSGHLQTWLTGFYRPRATLADTIEHRIPIAPWGHMLVHENRPESPGRNGFCGAEDSAVLLLHGLGSSHAGTYMTNIAKSLLDRGCRVFRADLPGAGPSCHTTPLPPHGACYDQVREGLNHLSRTLGITRWRIGGVSLGGNILLKMLAESVRDPGKYPLDFAVESAVAVAPPIDLAECCSNIERGFNRVYSNYFMRILKKQSQQRAAMWPIWQEVLQDADFSSIRRFDATVTSRLAGFRNEAEYYSAGSSVSVLKHIEVPTTILVDSHDPIVPYRLFDPSHFSRRIRLVKTEFGGHVGYLYRHPFWKRSEDGAWMRWADSWIAEELLAISSER